MTPSIESYFRNWATKIIDDSSRIPLIMVSGAQGIGKSTAMHAIEEHYEKKVIVLGIDEFYMTKAQRRELAQTISPLLETRGAPGTHDLSLLDKTITQLLGALDTTETILPVFDKIIDDRKAEDKFKTFKGRPKAIILEGWMIGALPDEKAASSPPMNSAEENDIDGKWRHYQFEQLAGPYSDLWDRADYFFHIDAPSFDVVKNWRIQQEETTLKIPFGTLPDERRKWVENFILYYERLTKRMLDGHKRSGATLKVDANRQPLSFENIT